MCVIKNIFKRLAPRSFVAVSLNTKVTNAEETRNVSQEEVNPFFHYSNNLSIAEKGKRGCRFCRFQVDFNFMITYTF